jgi:hypothetical protein
VNGKLSKDCEISRENGVIELTVDGIIKSIIEGWQ